MHIFGKFAHIFGKLVQIFARKLVSRTSKQVSRNLGLLWQPGVYNDTGPLRPMLLLKGWQIPDKLTTEKALALLFPEWPWPEACPPWCTSRPLLDIHWHWRQWLYSSSTAWRKGALKGTELRRQREPKTQIFAKNRRFSQIYPFSCKFQHLEAAGNHRFSQETEDFRRKPQEIADWAPSP